MKMQTTNGRQNDPTLSLDRKSDKQKMVLKHSEVWGFPLLLRMLTARVIITAASRHVIHEGLGTRYANFACNLLSLTIGDPIYSSHRSLPLMILSISATTKTEEICTWEVKNISPFLLSCDRSVLRMWNAKGDEHSFSMPILPQGMTSAANVYWIDTSSLAVLRMFVTWLKLH